MIKVDPGKCLGCLSCSNVCPNQNIVLLQSADTRTVHWKKCKEECDLCVEFCPAKALALVAYDELVPESEISFELVACRVCGSRYATLPMLMKAVLSRYFCRAVSNTSLIDVNSVMSISAGTPAG